MAEIRTFPNAEQLAQAAAEHFVEQAAATSAARGRFSVALSGGSTPRAMHRHLVTLAGQVDWTHVHIFWGDERCAPPDHADSNYRMARETLLDHVPIPPDKVHRIRGEAGPELAAAEYEHELRTFFGDETPRFDLIYLGLGDDGHTASLFPGTAAVREPPKGARWVAAVEHTTPPPPLVARVSLTPVALNAARQVTFLVAGAGKAERLREVLNGPYQPERLPAQIVKPANGHLTWFVDEAAARLIS